MRPSGTEVSSGSSVTQKGIGLSIGLGCHLASAFSGGCQCRTRPPHVVGSHLVLGSWQSGRHWHLCWPGELAHENNAMLHSEAAMAQLGERQAEDLKVPGSIPDLGKLLNIKSDLHQP